MDKTKPNLIDLIKDLADDHIGKSDFTEAFAKVVETVKELRAQNEAEFAAIQETVDLLGKKLSEDNTNDLTSFKGEASSIIQAAIDAANASVADKLTLLDQRISEIKDGEPGPRGEQGPQGPAGSPDTSEDIRNKLELLEGDERLKASAISGLEDLIKQTVPQSSNGTNFVVSRGAVKMYDLSALLDGSTKTFALPAFWRVISVHSSSFPHIMRPTTDYTTDGAAMTLTFTAEIDAATVLAEGQSIIVIYGEA